MSAQATLDRLAPQDFYRRIDRLRSSWHGDVTARTDAGSSEARYADYRRQDALDVHERKIAAQLVTLRRLIQQLPPRFCERALLEYEELKRGRIAEGADWLGALSRLRRIVSEWDSSRPPLVDCPECGLAIRGQFALKNHLLIVHDLEGV